MTVVMTMYYHLSFSSLLFLSVLDVANVVATAGGYEAILLVSSVLDCHRFPAENTSLPPFAVITAVNLATAAITTLSHRGD